MTTTSIITLAQVLVFIILLIVFMRVVRTEDFATKQDKAQAIYTWFSAHPRPNYVAYKADVPGSDIVEYEDVLALTQHGQLSVDAIEAII